MGIFDGVLLASDYDGTLRGNDTLEVLPQDIQAIAHFQEEGGTFILTTGRCYAAFYQQAKALPLRSPSLLSNGASFCRMDTGEELFVRNLPDRAPSDMTELAQAVEGVAFETYHGDEIYCCHPNAYTHWHMQLVQGSYLERPFREMPTPWLKVLLEGEHAALEQARAYITRHWGDWYECIFSNEHLLELTGKGVHKGTGVAAAAEYFGIEPRHIYCVGDNDNDMPMLLRAREGFAPQGSVAARRGEGRLTITRDADHGCLADVVERLERRYGG